MDSFHVRAPTFDVGKSDMTSPNDVWVRARVTFAKKSISRPLLMLFFVFVVPTRPTLCVPAITNRVSLGAGGLLFWRVSLTLAYGPTFLLSKAGAGSKRDLGRGRKGRAGTDAKRRTATRFFFLALHGAGKGGRLARRSALGSSTSDLPLMPRLRARRTKTPS